METECSSQNDRNNTIQGVNTLLLDLHQDYRDLLDKKQNISFSKIQLEIEKRKIEFKLEHLERESNGVSAQCDGILRLIEETEVSLFNLKNQSEIDGVQYGLKTDVNNVNHSEMVSEIIDLNQHKIDSSNNIYKSIRPIELKKSAENPQLARLKLPKEYESIKYLIIRSFGGQLTCNEFLALSDCELLNIPSFGRVKLDSSHRLKELMSNPNFIKASLEHDFKQVNIDITHPIESYKWPPRAMLADLTINYGILPESQQKLIDFLSRKLNLPLNQITIANVIYDFIPEHMGRVVAGLKLKGVLNGLKEIIEKNMNALLGKSAEELKSQITGGSLLSYAGYLAFSLDELTQIINDDLTTFLDNLDEYSAAIFRARFGLDGVPKLTLQSIADSLPDQVTREYIRQVQNKTCDRLLSSLSVHSANIWANVKENLFHGVGSLYPQLYQRFSEEKAFIRFLELICEIDKGEISSFLIPSCNADFVCEMAEREKCPFSKEALVSVLSEQYGFGEQQAKNALDKLIKENLLKCDDEGIWPLRLSKVQAIGQAALYFRDGAPFREIHLLANQQGLCESVFPNDRVDNGMHFAVDRGLLYLCSQGTYRHSSFLNVSEEEKDEILKEVLMALESAACLGINNLHLKVDVYEKAQFSQDYFVIRHVVRESGVKFGIHFSGKSSADTVSLNKVFSQKSQKEALALIFKDDPKNRTIDEIASIIRSGSVKHAFTIANELIEEGKLARIDRIQYNLPEAVYKNVPVASILERAESILINADRAVEIGIIVDDCNTRFHLQHPYYWYISLLRWKCNDWHFNYNLISRYPLHGLTISKYVRNIYGKVGDDLAIKSFVHEKILVSDLVLKRVLCNVKESLKNQ